MVYEVSDFRWPLESLKALEFMCTGDLELLSLGGREAFGILLKTSVNIIITY